MADQYVLFVDNLDQLNIKELSRDKIETALARTVNSGAGEARIRSAERMTRQVNFPAGYLKPENRRFYQSRQATKGSPEAEISARFRATSLARFSTGAKVRNGVTVAVKPGRQRLIKNAFLMKLNSGNDGAKSNLGLAVRTKRGQRPRGAFRPVQINDRLWLLYGPSVSQVFKSVRQDVSPDTAIHMQQEFSRLIEREFKK